MKLTVLVDNNTYIDNYCLGEPALSYYIEDKDIKILFDTGYSDIFIRNANKLGINLKDIDVLVISHGHNDHTGGLKYYFKEKQEVKLIAHIEAFNNKISEGIDICSPLSANELQEKCDLILSKEPVKISENIMFLGEIPQSNNYEERRIIGEQIIDGNAKEDRVLDDTALVYKNEDGLHVITGCSHSGICNIVEYAKKVCKDDRVISVVGGFHLFKVDEQVNKTIKYFKDNKIKELYPCHCTSFEVRAEIHKQIPLKEVGVGLKIIK